MKLLFTSYTGVYTFDTNYEKLEPVHLNSGMYYGITWHNNKVYVAARNSISDYRLGNESILVFNKNLKFIESLPLRFPNHGLHSILIDPDTGWLWVTASLKNKLVLVNLENNQTKDYYPNKLKKDIDYNHFNSLTTSGTKMLLNAHNHQRGSSIWILNRGKSPKVTSEINMPGATQSHCCWKFLDKYYTCASHQGQVTSNKGNKVLPKTLSGYTRGIVLTSKWMLVGESARAVREDRAKAGGFIHLYDRSTMQLIKTYKFPKIGQIAEIRVLDHLDDHHWPKPLL